MLLVDAHVHLHDCFDLESLLDSAYANFGAAADRLGCGDEFAGVLLLAETVKQNFFHQLFVHAGDKDPHRNRRAGKWDFRRTGETGSLISEDADGRRLVLIAGRQLITEEGLEVLALATTNEFNDGVSTTELICNLGANGAVAVVPWGFGKWLGRRGKIIDRLLNKSSNYSFFLGDNSNRPFFLPSPSQFRLARSKGIHNLQGSDPLPFATEFNRAGIFGFSLPGFLSFDHPSNHLKTMLLDPKNNLQTFGRLERPLRFIRNQFLIQISKYSQP
jgi:hypothetical protein